jgi:hypothetical protein
MGGLEHLAAVEAHVACFHQFGGKAAMLHNTGKPQPFIKALGQV